MSRHMDERELEDLFAGIEAPPGLDRWRERIADVHAEHEPADENSGVTELRPRTRKKRSLAVAAAVVGLVGLGGVVVTSRLLDAPPADPTMIIDGPDRTTNPPSSPPSSPAPSSSTTTPPPSSGP